MISPLLPPPTDAPGDISVPMFLLVVLLLFIAVVALIGMVCISVSTARAIRAMWRMHRTAPTKE